MNTKVITEIADYISKETGYEIPPMTPFVGENFNLTRAGIHADGMLKNHEIYNIFDTDTLLDRPPKVSVTHIRHRRCRLLDQPVPQEEGHVASR